MNAQNRKLAVVTGASSGIGLELARCCAKNGYDLVIASDEDEIEAVAEELTRENVSVTPLKIDLAVQESVDLLCDLLADRPVDALLANAGHGLGHAFLDQDFSEITHVLNTNITGTIYLVHKIGQNMKAQGEGRILLTGSIAGYMPGSFQAVYNGTKAFIDSFSYALREELKETGVTVTCLMPGATDTNFFDRADMLDTKVGQGKKDDPREVAESGFQAMLNGEDAVIFGVHNKLQVAASHITPDETLAKRHRAMAEPGSGAGK